MKEESQKRKNNCSDSCKNHLASRFSFHFPLSKLILSYISFTMKWRISDMQDKEMYTSHWVVYDVIRKILLNVESGHGWVNHNLIISKCSITCLFDGKWSNVGSEMRKGKLLEPGEYCGGTSIRLHPHMTTIFHSRVLPTKITSLFCEPLIKFLVNQIQTSFCLLRKLMIALVLSIISWHA